MYKLVAVVVIVLITACTSKAQLKIDGPTKANAGDFVRIRVTEMKGKDLQVQCVPENQNWEATKNLQDQVVIFFSPVAKKEDTVYYFIFAVNSSDKTYLTTFMIFIPGTAPPIPPTPNPPTPPVPPTPTPDDTLTSQFRAKYLVNPNKAQLTKYIAVLDDLRQKNEANQFTSYKQAWDYLVSGTKASLQSDTDLRSLRDDVAKYLVSKTGNDFTKYDKQTLSSALTDIITSLRKIESSVN